MQQQILGNPHDHIASAISLAAVVGVFVGWLPHLAALGAVIWYGMLMVTWIVNKGWRPKE